MTPARARWLALIAALLGWMFDGLEMGLFPLVGRPALRELVATGDEDPVQLEKVVGAWFSVINAGFLIGAATGGVLFGWLGDRIGRVRAMTLSVLVYAGCSGACGFSAAPWQLATLRFAGALGMGGEWALGVALVMEMWPGASRAWLAGLIGAFGNLGYFLLGLIAMGLNRVGGQVGEWLTGLGVGADTVNYFTRNGNWRLLMAVGALPAVLTLFIRLFVPESEKWAAEKDRGAANHWRGNDLQAVLLGAAVGAGVLTLWVVELPLWVRIAGTLAGVAVITVCYLFPTWRYFVRANLPKEQRTHLIGRMLLAAGLSGVPLVATWGGVMWVYNLVDVHVKAQRFELGDGFTGDDARPLTQASSAFGAAVGCLGAALLGGLIGRKWAYVILCVLSGAALYSFYAFYPAFFDWGFVLAAGGVGLITAAFYGWLPLYLPELFPTRVRAMGQGFGFNFGRILASVGSLQTGALLAAFDGDYAKACSVAAGVYVLGLVLVLFAPETKGKPLPE
jgi:SHS family sialic acid transporter-like MFS transporter